MEKMGFTLVQTCNACPEQYDVLDKSGNQVAYMRLRHGQFVATDPSQTTIIYEAQTKGDGLFEADERDFYLNEAIFELIKYRGRA